MRTILAGVRLIDGVADGATGPVDIETDGDRIAAIRRSGEGPTDTDDAASRARPETEVIDGRGWTALPGLIDAHAHYTFDPTEGSLQAIAARSDEAILAAAARHAGLALRAGVTTARGAGSIRGLELVLRDRIAVGEVAGPRLIAAGLAVGAVEGHGTAFGVEATGPAALAVATHALIDRGADVVKIVASEAAMLTTTGHEPGRMVFGRAELTEDELRAIVEVAHARGRRVMAHAQDYESVIRCAQAGVDSVEHAWLADEAAIEVLAASGAALVPTLGVTDVNRTLPGLTPAQRERQDLIERRHRASTETAVRLGIPLATGTDTGEVGVTADHVWREIVLLREHGASSMVAIRAATSSAARLLGVASQTGTIAVGMLADIVCVEGDPLADLERLAAPRLVMQAGRIVTDA
ncbi:MAG TPA: amidohydrolase family protein [Candidatus Sulfomarinibacteraceae bacterium]|nr:amidohydrolase family protein [Candidatus Sulfomarinibacteraceae bacterium]